ncbi:pyridoxamine-phosphate oxidase [Aspergillus niger]
MRFVTLVFAALAAGPLAAFAAPAPAEDAAQSCPDGAKIHCGSCNGTSCRIGFENYSCNEGSCTKQSGGGDGASCWDDNLGGPRHIVCPGKA